MLQATYKGDDLKYNFYISTEDRRYDNTTTNTAQTQFLFKFTNNMDKRVVYAYAQSVQIFDRYTICAFLHNTTENVFEGKVNFQPNGYYNYEVYELTSETIQALSCSTAPITEDGTIGQYTITNGDGVVTSTVKLTGKNDVYDLALTEADAGASNWNIKIYNGCSDSVPILTSGFYFPAITAMASGKRWAEFTKVTQIATGIELTILSNMPVGYSWEITNSVTGAIITTHNITSSPENKTINLSQINPPSSAPLSLLGYDANDGSLGGGGYAWSSVPMVINPVQKPSNYYGIGEALVVNPVSVNGSGTILSKGSAWLSIIAGASAESTVQGFYTLRGLVEQGKLYVSEPKGEEQVQYTQHPEPSGTNYIWYGE
jgi:hypothetical protein